ARILSEGNKQGSALIERRPEVLSAAVKMRLKVEIGEGPLVTETHNYGGAPLLKPNLTDFGCTTGFTVDGPDGLGFLTAGHCNTGERWYVQPNTTIAYLTTFHDNELGEYGDSQYRRAASHNTYAHFYADNVTTRRLV